MPDRHSLHRPLVFYDTETTGTNIDFDQILQFAAILTTPDFKELDRLEIRCRRLPWVVPSPGAMLVTGITPRQLDDPSLPLFPEMMTTIRDKLQSWSPAIFLGYNSIRFDEALLQRAFWQNLYPPYLTVTDGNGRLDVLPLVRAVSRIAAHALKIPNAASGRPSYRLDRLAPLNGFAHKQAHDALGDVEATIHIAKRLASRAPKLWTAAIDRSDNDFVADVLQRSTPVFIMEPDASGKPGWWGLLLGQHGDQRSNQIVARLDQNWKQFFSLNRSGQHQFLSRSPAPVRQIRTNRAPLVFDVADAQASFGIAPSNEELTAADTFVSTPDRKNLVKGLYVEAQPTWPAPSELEQRLFEAFYDKNDERLLSTFHSVPWIERSDMVRQFGDGLLRQIAQRLVYLMAPTTMTDAERKRVREGIRQRLLSGHDNTAMWRTIGMAKEELGQHMRSSVDQERLGKISDWLDDLASEVERE